MKKSYTFEQLTDSQKQIIASRWWSDVAHGFLENTLVEYVLNSSWEDSEAPFSYDDISNYEYYGSVAINGSWEELTESDRDEKLEFYEYLRDKTQDLCESLEITQDLYMDDMLSDKQLSLYRKLERYEYICDTLEAMGFDCQPEIYQWFFVSDYAASKLNEEGQCIVNGNIWGRQCCGQSVELDHVIQKLAFEYYCDYNSVVLTEDNIKDNNFEQSTFWSL